ncbi:MAG TPA: hypothetical protein DD391_02425 [Clostridiales bacterium]|nr:EAL domain-containing protein [Clostridiales bacterium]HBL81446.1 hypothetical protein [Clostridiales bacterium]
MKQVSRSNTAAAANGPPFSVFEKFADKREKEKKTWLGLGPFPILLLCVMLSSLIVYQFFGARAAEQKIYATLSDLADQETRTVQSNLNGQFSTLEALSAEFMSQTNFELSDITARMRAIVLVSDFTKISVAGQDGKAYDNDGEVVDCKNRQCFIEALSGKRAIERLDASQVKEGRTRYMIAVPLKKGGLVKGAVIGVYNEKMFDNVTSVTSYQGQGASMLVASDGTILTKSESSVLNGADNLFNVITPQAIDRKFTAEDVQERLKNGEEFFVSYKTPFGRHYAIAKPLGFNNWSVCYTVSDNAFLKERRANFIGSMLLGSAILVCSLLLFFLILNKQNKIEKLHKRQVEQYSRDGLTGLLNERGFEIRANEILRRSDRPYYIVCYDVNNFAVYNNLMGLDGGNDVLKTLASVSLSSKQDNEICARLYADEFVCLLTADSIDGLFQKIYQVNSRFRDKADGHNHILISYGVFEITDKAMPVRQMVDCAKTAKKAVKGNYNQFIGIYTEEMKLLKTEERQLIFRMEDALENGEFYAVYQPKFGAKTRSVVSCEALACWRRGDGVITPDKFIGLFEENGFILKLDFYMFELVCKTLREYIRGGIVPVPVAVNFSQIHIYEPDFPERLMEIITRYQIPPSYIEIEFTETAMSSDVALSVQTIQQLKQRGFTVAMDDFGSGYSSLTLLRSLPVDVVKLDRGFLAGNETDERGKCVIRSVIELSKQLKFETVAEGVETKEQMELCIGYGCDIMQGYYFSKPLPEEEFKALLKNKTENKK